MAVVGWLLLATSGNPAVAQDSIPRLPPIIVESLGAADSLADLPVAVTRLERPDAGVSGLALSALFLGVPGVEVQDRYNPALGDRLAVRGFGARTQFGVRGIRVLIDGIPATTADGQTTIDHLDPTAVQEVEVIRAPVAFVHGNSAAGIVSLRTLELSGERSLAAHIGADATGGVRTAWSSRSLAARGSYQRLDGHREHSEAERLQMSGLWTTTLGPGRVSLTSHFVDLSAENPGSLDSAAFTSAPESARQFNVTQNTRKDVTQGQLGLSWETGEVARHTLSAWVLRRDLTNPIPTAIIDLDRLAGGGLVELERTAAGIHWVAGGGMEWQRDGRLNFENDGGQPGDLILAQDEAVTSAALFVRGDARISQSTRVLAGVRYDGVRFAVVDELVQGGGSEDRFMDALSPSIGLVANLDGRVTAWGNAARSFETPTTTELVNRPSGAGGLNPNLEPQTATALEVGLRSRARGLWELVGFWSDVSDLLVPFEVEGSDGRTFFRNAGAARYRGVEASAAAGGRRWNVRAAYTLLDTEFREFVVDGRDLAGKRIPGVARHRLDGSLTVRAGPGSGELVVRHRSAVPANDGNSVFVESYTVADAALLLRSPEGRIRIRLRVNNILDRLYKGSVAVNAFGDRYYEPSPGRRVFSEIEVSF